MEVNLLPLASLLDQDRCALQVDLIGGAIRLGDRPDHVARSNGGVAEDPHVQMPDLPIVLDTSIKSGLDVGPLFFKRIESPKESAAGEGCTLWQVVLHHAACIPRVECSVNAQIRRSYIIHIVSHGDSRQKHSDNQ